jgi:hypothetical protein
LLYQATQDRSTTEQAWLWLSGVVDQDEQRLFCLDNVLRINPQNEPAKRGAGMLRQKGIFPTPIDSPTRAQPAPAPQSAFSDFGSTPPPVTPAPQYSPRPAAEVAQKPVASAPSQSPASQVQVSSQMAEYIARELQGGRSPQAVAKSLVDLGISPERAAAMVEQTQGMMGQARKANQNRNTQNSSARNQMISGLVIAIIGICATMISYNMANPGGKFTVWGGAIIIGVLNIIIGFFRWIVGLFSSK